MQGKMKVNPMLTRRISSIRFWKKKLNYGLPHSRQQQNQKQPEHHQGSFLRLQKPLFRQMSKPRLDRLLGYLAQKLFLWIIKGCNIRCVRDAYKKKKTPQINAQFKIIAKRLETRTNLSETCKAFWTSLSPWRNSGKIQSRLRIKFRRYTR